MLVADEATESFLGPNELSCVIKGGPNLFPLPEKRSEAGLRLAKTSGRIRDGPITNEMVFLEFLIELFKRHWVLAFAQAKIGFNVQSSMFKVRNDSKR